LSIESEHFLFKSPSRRLAPVFIGASFIETAPPEVHQRALRTLQDWSGPYAAAWLMDI